MGNRVRLAVYAAVAVMTLTLGTKSVKAQQFGPSPQAMYKSHPGSAPTYVSYGPQAPDLTSSTHSYGSYSATTRTRTRSTASRTRTTVRRRITSVAAARTQRYRGTNGR